MQLCRGASAPERKRWCLPEHVEAFKYLAGSGCSEIAGTDDAANFGVVRNSLSRLGISDSQQARMHAVYRAGEPRDIANWCRVKATQVGP